MSFAELVERASQLPEPLSLGGSRLVVHVQTSPQAVEDLLALIRKLAEEKKAAGFVAPEKKSTPNGRSYSSVYVKVKRPAAEQK